MQRRDDGIKFNSFHVEKILMAALLEIEIKRDAKRLIMA